jgi:hypothetical protein
MKVFYAMVLICLLQGCVSQQLKTASVADLTQAVAITQNPDFPNPILAECLQKYLAFVQAACTTNCGIGTTIAEKQAITIIDSYPACIITKAKIQAFFAKFGLVVPIQP